ncbi:MAG: hypothetical protein KAY50_09850 [Chitinophagaceae bacterium]|nr:hypothetical protein [Chitinophagaceae bacterium]
MGYGYGIKQCRETLLLLSSEQNFESRMVKAFSEIGVIQAADVSKQYFKQINEWRRKYLAVTEFSISKDGSLQETDKEKEFRNLATELVWLCTEIIEHNARNTKKIES